ncbi:hypothetical protein MN116_002663 [Schistosoma mekongi]|uniref:Uncharacterized protein n=1 Tax=Schistosoma mekongi TaxID=38744 RepID=A0AAE2D5K0_SCHME|nr:hypothetical protein MN116_002663 [Schistosoma mekongi]
MYWIYIESLVLRSKIHKCNWRHVHNSSTIDFGIKEDRVDFVALFCSIIMITPNESQHSLNVNAFQSVSANLYHTPATKMAAIAASQSHCTRPSSVPGCFAHREGFSVSTKNQLSPVNSDNLSSYFKVSPTYQSSLSPATITCNKHASLDVKAGNHEASEKDYIPVNSPQSTPLTQDSVREGCEPSPFHHSDSHHYPCSSSTSNSPVSVECNVKSEFLSSFDFPKLCLKSDGGFNLNLPTDVILPETSNNRGRDAWNYHQRLMDVIITVVNQSGQILYHEKYFPSQHGLCLDNNDIARNYDNESYVDFANLQIGDDSWSGRIQDSDLEIWQEHTSKIFKEASRWLHARNAVFDDVLPNNNCEVADQHYQEQPSIDSSKSSRNRHLFDCPVYRLKLGRKLFYVHTFSLPIVSHTNCHLQSSELPLCEPLVVHYHSILRECDQNGELTGSNASACLKKAIAQSTSALSITAPGRSFVLNTIVPHPSNVTCSEKSVSSSNLIMPLADVNGRTTTEVSNCDNSKDVFLPIGHCHSHVNSLDLSGRRRTLYQKMINVDSIECNSTLHHADSSNCQSTANQYQSLLDPLHHHHHHHHHPHVHTGENSHNTYNPYFHQNDKSTITEFVPTSTSTMKSASPTVVRKSSARYHSGHSPTVDNNPMIQYENMNAIETFSDNNTTNYSLPSNTSNRSSESVLVHSDSEFVSSCRHNEINSCSTTFHCNNNNNTAIVCLSPNTSESLSVTPLTNSHSPPQNNESISSNENVTDENSTESFLNTLNNNTTTDHNTHHVDSSNVQQRSLNKNQYDRRILMLQHLLPPQAIQEIRQIWQEMNKNLKCDTEVPGISLKLPMATRVSAAATSPPTSLSHSVSSSIREHFARRVRQVVRQYLGPKAFITDNLSESQSETESCFKTNVVLPQSDRSKNSASVLDYNESRKYSALIPIISSPIEEKCVSLPSSIIGSITATTFTSSLIISPDDGKSSSNSNTPSTTEAFPCEITARKLSHSGVNELTESNVGVLLCPNVVSAATSEINNVQKVFSSCGTINNPPLSCMKQADELILSQPNNRSAETVVTTTSADTLDASDLPRVSTSSSQCCMLEWLLSEEADLCILPPSLCQSKIADKLQQSTSMTSPPLLSSVSCSQVILPITPCCTPSNQTQNFQYGSPITEIAHSPLPVLQPKVNSEQQTSNRSLLSSTNTSLITTMTTASANTSSIMTTPPSTTNTPHIEIRSSPQPRTESLLVRLLHPAKSHSLGYTDMNTHDGALPKLDSSSVAVTSQLISDTIDFHCSNAITNSVSDVNPQLQSSYNRKSESRLIAASLDNLCDNQLTVNTTTSKRCRSGPVTTTQSISLSSSSHIISPGNKRTRHASQFEEIIPPSSSTRKYSGTNSDTKHNSDGIPSPPFTSLTQLLLQDFPMISDIMSYSPNSMDSPKYTTPLFGPVKSLSNEQGYENLQVNNNLTTSFDKNKMNRPNISQSDKCFFTQHPPCVISGDKCTKNQSLFNNSNDGLSSSTEQCHEKLLSLTSTSSLPCSVKSKLENKDRHPLLLDAQLQPDEIIDAVAKVEKCSDISFQRSNASINNYNKEESSSIETSSFKTNSQTTSVADKNQSFSKSFSSNCYMDSSSVSMTNISDQSMPQPSSYSIAPVEWNDDDLQQLIHEAITDPSDNILKENNNPRTNSPSPSSSLLPKRHPSTSSKEISEEVEILCEILRRDELERTNQKVTDCCQPLNQCDATITAVNSYNNNSMSYISESPSSKRSRFSSSTSISDHQLDASDNLVTIDSDSTYCKNEVTWQNDAKAVARICEQLQQGLVTEKSVYTSLNNSNNNTSASSNNTPKYLMPLNDMMISPTQTSTNYNSDTNCTQNLNADALNLNATTVISSNSPSISSVSRGSHFYHHHPEDLSRFLKEVGPNVRVQLSCSIPTSNSNHHQLNNANKTQYVYHPTPQLNSGTMKMQQSPLRHQFTTKVITTTSSMFPHSQTTNIVLQSGIASPSSLSSYRTPLTASVYSNSFISVHNPKATSSDESVLDTLHQFPLADNTNTINNIDNSHILKSELRQGLVDRQGIYQNNAAITTDCNRSFKYSQVSDQLSDPILSVITYQDCSSSSDVDQLPPSSCLSSSSLPCVSRLPASLVLNQTICSTANPMYCRQLSLPQPVYIHQEIHNSNPSSCNTYPQSVQSVRSYHHSQGFPNTHKTDTFDFFTQNDSSHFNTTLNHPDVVCPLTPSSLSPISVSANTSPCSSTTSQPPGFLKSPTCQQLTELAYSSTSDTLVNNYYEANSTESLDCCFNNYLNYPTLHRSISTVSSSSTLSYNPLSRLQDHDNQDNTATTVIDPYLDSSMLPSNYKQQYYHHQQQQQEENLLPDDLINDVFDLEIMIAAKQKQEQQQQYYQQYHYQNSTTHGLDFLTSPTPTPDALINKQPLLSSTTFNNNNRVVSQPPPTIILNSTNQCTSAATVVVVVTRRRQLLVCIVGVVVVVVAVTVG